MPPARLAEFDKAWESCDGAGKQAGAAGLSVGNIRDVMSSIGASVNEQELECIFEVCAHAPS